MDNQLITVKRLPIIEQHFKELSKEIDTKVEEINALAVTEDTVKAVKKVLADFRKDYKALEKRRIAVKAEINAPYIDFEDLYKEYVGNKYTITETKLKAKIDEIENGVKKIKEDEARAYFTEQGIDFVQFEQVGLNITLGVTVKALKQQIDEFVNRIKSDLELITTQNYEAEILVEYRETLNCSQSIRTITERYKAIEEEIKRQEARRKAEEVRKAAQQKAIEEEEKRLAERKKAIAEAKKAEEEEQKRQEEQQKAIEKAVEEERRRAAAERQRAEEKAIEEEQILQAEDAQVEEFEQQQLEEEPETITPEEMTVTLRVTATLPKLKRLKQYLEAEGIKFE